MCIGYSIVSSNLRALPLARKKLVLFSCQNIQACDYIPTLITAKMSNYYYLISEQYLADQLDARLHDVRNVVIFLNTLTRKQDIFSSQREEGFW